MRKFNKKGFTLIELLAVIIILGVLLLIAIPSMNSIIEGAKRDSYVNTGKSYIQAVRYEAIQGNYQLPGPGQYTAVATDLIDLESGSKKSPYDQPMKNDLTFVLIVNKGTDVKDEYVYYYQAVDQKNHGTRGLVAENSLDRNSIVKSTADDNAKSLTTLNGSSGSLSLDSKNYTKAAVYRAS